MIEVTLPRLSAAQEQSWLALLELGRRVPTGWTIVGGQLVYLHGYERGIMPSRPTDDGDAALDVRARPEILHEFTSVLVDMGFTADPPDWRGHQHRWTKDGAVIDVLIPRFVGERASSRTGVTGGTTLQAPGAQKALDRSELVRVNVAGQTGIVPRPTLAGAVAAKASALQIQDDPGWRRHVQDMTILSTMLRASDDLSVYSAAEVRRVRNAIGRTVQDRSIVAAIDGAEVGLQRLRLALDNVERRRELGQLNGPQPRRRGTGRSGNLDQFGSSDRTN